MGKSQCCGVVVWRIGERRRRCSSCRRTWRVWPKKRGRARLRSGDRLIQKVFFERRSLTELAKQKGLSRQALSYRFLRALQSRLRRSKCHQPDGDGDLVLVVDGLWFRFKKRPWVMYLMAFKMPQDHKAVFIDPVLQQGTESREGWVRAFDSIPEISRTRIRALVSDNFAGSTTLASSNGWVHQLCQFHLVASLRARLGHLHYRTVKAQSIRRQGYALVRAALTTNDNACLNATLERLQTLTEDPGMPWKFGNILREFIRRIDNYRAYQLHPELRLPRTTGSLESMGRVLRDVMHRSRSVTTPKSLNLWITNYMQLRSQITCNPGNFYSK